MDIHIQKLLINPQDSSFNWYSLLYAIIPGLITWFAMWFIDNQNKKRWLNDGYLKRKIELEIEIRQILLNIKRQTDLLPDINQFEDLINKELSKNDLDLLNKINSVFHEIRWDHPFKHRTIILNRENDIFDEDEYMVINKTKIEPLIDEYMIFNKTKKEFLEKFLKIYNSFLKTKIISNRTLNGDIEYKISETIFDSNKEEIKLLISNCYQLKKQIDELLQIIEKNFEINKKSCWQFWKR